MKIDYIGILKKTPNKRRNFMGETTIYLKEATAEPQIQQIEYLLNQIEGMERVLIDIDDGEIKMEFDENTITAEEIASTLMEQNFFIM